ncbi:MAG: Ig-like domain-containing protein, partial [Candidatus Thermoplasmatota archaeon]|nr:Ig-like domain-containing protein [Candidatus Thermoplasmatota archaeon]
DVFGNVWAISPVWSVWGGVGVVNGSGFFVAEFVGSGFVNASFGGKNGSASVGVSAGDPVTMVLLDGDGQTAVVNETCPQPLRVRVLDAYGNPVPGVSTSWNVVSRPFSTSGGVLSSSLVQTGVDGVASVTFRLGKHVGDYGIGASGSGLVGSPVDFVLSAVHGALDSVVVSPGSVSLRAGEELQFGVVGMDVF